MSDKLPDKINEKLFIVSQAGMEVLKLIREYNTLSAGNPKRKEIYKKIEELVEYEQHWD